MPTEPEEQLEEVQETIDEAKRSAAEAVPELDKDERRFYETGEKDEGEPVDQTIVPPG